MVTGQVTPPVWAMSSKGRVKPLLHILSRGVFSDFNSVPIEVSNTASRFKAVNLPYCFFIQATLIRRSTAHGTNRIRQ